MDVILSYMLSIMVQLKCNNFIKKTFFLFGMYVLRIFLISQPNNFALQARPLLSMKISFATPREPTEATTNSISTPSSFKMALRASIQRVSRDLPR